ncbi:hypothetical protein HDU98_011769 [Podochytrium sp. JEL0797]|nr:hypothetical protein HDU98_011769 [Podochytrium sp. JEL0797]
MDVRFQHVISQWFTAEAAIEALRTASFVLFVCVSLYFLVVPATAGRGGVVLHHAKHTASLTVFDSASNTPRRISLLSLVTKNCPSILAGFRPTPLLCFSGHLQTAFAAVASSLPYKRPPYQREMLTLPDGGLVAIDWLFPELGERNESRPIVVLFHGLAGGSNETYICESAFEAVSRGYTVAALNYRGSNKVPLKTPQLYAGSYTQDARLILKHIQSKNPSSPLIGIGFSLGANMLLKYVGEDGPESPLLACVSVANPFDFNLGINFLHSTMMGRFYSRFMTKGLVAIFDRHAHMFPADEHHPNHSAPISAENVKASKTLTDFDENLTRRVFGYRTVNEFYRMGGSAQYVPDIRIPTLLLNSLDDPIALEASIPIADVLHNPLVILGVTKYGGHLGYFESLFGWGGGYKRWFKHPVFEFVDAIVDAQNTLPSHLKSSFLETSAAAMKPQMHIHYQGNRVWELQHDRESPPSSSRGGSRSASPLKFKIDSLGGSGLAQQLAPVEVEDESSDVRGGGGGRVPSAALVARSNAPSEVMKKDSSYLFRVLQFVLGLTSETASQQGQGWAVRRVALVVLKTKMTISIGVQLGFLVDLALSPITLLAAHINALDTLRWFLAIVTLLVVLYFLLLPSDVELHHAKDMPLAAAVRKMCPSLVGRYFPTPYLFSGHHQTIFAGLVARVTEPSMHFYNERELIVMPHGGQATIDWSHVDSPETPVIILVHGIDGDSADRYILAMIPPILAKGYRVAALNGRGQSDVAITTPQLYSGSFTQDVRSSIHHVQTRFPNAPLVGIGFSLGANILTKCVGEDGSKSPLVGCISVGNPFDLHQGLNLLHSTLVGRQVYSKAMTKSLVATFGKHQEVFRRNARSAKYSEAIDADNVMDSKFLHEFDERVTRRALGFRSLNEYYRQASSHQFILDIKIPTLILSDRDDPIVNEHLIPFADVLGNPNVILATTNRGGHLGWFEGVFSPKRWFPKPVMEFVEVLLLAHASKQQTDKRSKAKSTVLAAEEVVSSPTTLSACETETEPVATYSDNTSTTASETSTPSSSITEPLPSSVVSRTQNASHSVMLSNLLLRFARQFGFLIPQQYSSESQHAYTARRFATYCFGVWALFLASKKRGGGGSAKALLH